VLVLVLALVLVPVLVLALVLVPVLVPVRLVTAQVRSERVLAHCLSRARWSHCLPRTPRAPRLRRTTLPGSQTVETGCVRALVSGPDASSWVLPGVSRLLVWQSGGAHVSINDWLASAAGTCTCRRPRVIVDKIETANEHSCRPLQN
jgi:hypothetical protein